MSGRVDGPSDLTTMQRKALLEAREYLDTPPTLTSLCVEAWKRTLLTVVLFTAVSVGLLLYFDRPTLAWLIGGMGLGTLARDFGYLRRHVQLWPATAAVIDRNKLDKLIGDLPPISDR